MIKLITTLFVYLLTLCIPLSAIQIPQHSTKVRQAFTAIQKLPEVRQLISTIEKEGPIHVDIAHLPNEEFDAYWESTDRLIRINESRNEKFGILICSLLFELHNARADREIVRLGNLAYSGRMTKDQYVESVERLEYQNAMQTSALLEKGISLNIFPADAKWPLYRNFDDHYKAQQILGHSGWIADQYDSMLRTRSVYHGTIPKNLTDKEKQDMLRYMEIKSLLESQNESQASRGFTLLMKEYALKDALRDRAMNLALGRNNEFKGLIVHSLMYGES